LMLPRSLRRGGRGTGGTQHSALKKGPDAVPAVKSTRACVGDGPEDGPGVVVDHLAKVHGDGKQENEEKNGEVEKRMQKLGIVIHRKEMEVHPEKDDDRENGEHPDDDARDAFGLIGGCQG